MSVAPPSRSLVERLSRDKQALAERVVEDMYSDAFWNERFAARGRKHSVQDLVFHVDYVIQAAEANDAGVMERYARWLQGVLTTRGICSLHLADSFGRLANAISDASARRYLSAARAALIYEGGSARAVQERIRDAITTGTPGTIEDTMYYLSYLADALALGQPKVFVDHVSWLRGYFEKQARDPHTIASTLETLNRTLDIEPARGVVSAALREITT